MKTKIGRKGATHWLPISSPLIDAMPSFREPKPISSLHRLSKGSAARQRLQKIDLFPK